MATSPTKIGPIFRGANGGMSDDLFTGGRNSFYYSEGVEPLEDAMCIYPRGDLRNRAVDLGLSSTVGNRVKYILPVAGDELMVFCERKIMYYTTNSSGERILVDLWTRTGSELITDAEVFNKKIFFSTTNHLYSIDYNTAITATSAWSSSDITSMSLTSSSYHPLYASDICLVVGDKNGVKRILRETMGTFSGGYELQDGYTVKFLGEMGGYIRVVVDDGQGGSEIHFWDKSKNAASEIVSMQGYRFLQSFIYQGYHYLLTDKGLGLLNGYQFYMLKKRGMENPGTYDEVTNGMLMYDDKLYIARHSGRYVYGAKNKNYNEVAYLWRKHEDVVGALATSYSGGDNLLFAGYRKRSDVDNKFHTYVGRYGGDSSTRYPQSSGTGELQTMAYFGDSLSTIKQAQGLKVGFDIKGGGEIKISYRTDADVKTTSDSVPSDWGRHQISEPIDYRRNLRSPFSTFIKMNCRFQRIQFRFEMRGNTSSYGRKPKLYSADLYYDNIIE